MNKQNIVLKFEVEPETTRECPLCGKKFYHDNKTWFYIEGTSTPVCPDCAPDYLKKIFEAMNRRDVQVKEALAEIKREKLKHYQEREPMLFSQIDAFVDAGEDDMFKPDKRGVCIFGGDTWELMNGATIRILIRADVKREEVERGLLSIREAMEKNDFNYEFINQDIEAKALKRFGVKSEPAKDNSEEDIPF